MSHFRSFFARLIRNIRLFCLVGLLFGEVTRAQFPEGQPFQAHFEQVDLNVNLCWPTRPGCLYRVESGEHLTDFTPTNISRYGNGGVQRVHVYSQPPPVPPVPDPNPPPPDLRPMDLLYFTVNPFSPEQTTNYGYPDGATLFTWHQRASGDEPAQVCRVLYSINLVEIPAGETVGRFPTFLFYYNIDPANTHKLHYDFSTWTSPFQPAYLASTELNLSPGAAAVFNRLKSQFPAIIVQASEQMQAQAVAQVPEPVPYVPGQRKFYRVVETRLDTDGDGVFDDLEMTDHNTDPYSYDTDGDGYSDGHEIEAGSDAGNAAETPVSGGPGNSGGGSDGNLPASEDLDGDGLNNEEELKLGTNPRNKDTDNDGAWDGAEMHPTEKLLTFARGMSGRYIDLEVGEGTLVSVSNDGRVIYKSEGGTNQNNETVYDYYLWEASKPGVTNLPSTVGDDPKAVISYGGINEGGVIYGSAQRKSTHSNAYYSQAFKMGENLAITWLKGSEEIDQAPPQLPPVEYPGSGSNPLSYGSYFAVTLGMDRYESIYGTEGRTNLSGNVPADFTPEAVLVSRSLTIWGNGAGNYGAVGAYFLDPNGDAPEGKEITAGTLLALSPEGRSVSMQERVTWMTTKGGTLINEPAYEGGSYFSVMNSEGSKLGLYYRRNTSSTVSDGNIPNNSVMMKFPASGDPNNIQVATISDMAKEESSPAGNGFMNGPIVGGSFQGKASFWIYKSGKWERSEIKTGTTDGPPKESVMGEVSVIEDDGDMWVDDGAGNYSLWNGRELRPFAKILEVNGFEAPETYELKRITTKGIIGCEKAGVVKLLLPLGIENPRGAIHELQVTSAKPRVELDKITTTDVTVSGDQASVMIKGKVFDPVTGLLPSGSPAPAQLRVYLNSSLQSTTVNLQREPKTGNVWKPHGDEFSFQSFAITFPAKGVNLIRVETSANAAGFTGSAEFEVLFRPEFAAQPASPALTILQDILLPSSFDPLTKDTIHLAAVDGEAQIALTEIEVDNRIFKSEQGHLVIISEDFIPTAAVDELPCSLIIPGSPLAWGHRGLSGLCMETGGATLRFRYSETIPARARDSAKTSVLDSVHMLPGPAPHDGWFPILFRVGGHFEEAEVELMGETFPVKTVDGADYATTGEGAPLVGIVINREEIPVNPENDPPDPVLEFMYYDHTAGQVKSIPLDDAETTHEWKLNVDGRELCKDKLPLKQIKFVNADGSPSLGILPVPIETLEALLAGKQPLIDDEQYAFIALLGHIDGEVVRFGNFDAPQDFFDLIAGSAETLLQEDDQHVRLEKLGDRRFRTREKVLIYSGNDESGSPQEITKEQWLALRDLGYLAIHNLDKKVFWGKEDIEWLEKERGSFHPNPGEKMGIDGVTDRTKAKFYRYEGFEDHHLFNKYHEKLVDGKYVANSKAPVWSKLFDAEGFDVDEFTVPVRKKVHSKIQHLANKGWESFVTEVFDETTGELKPHVTGRVLAQKRGEAFALMHTLADQMGLKLHWCRPWPTVLDKRSTGHLFQILVNSRSHLGSSLNRLGAFSSKFLVVLGSEWQEEGMRLFRLHVKTLAKTGAKACLTCIPLLFSMQSHVAAQEMLVYTLAYESPKVGMAHWLDTSLALDDLPRAQEIVDILWDDLKDAINGETLVAQLPSGDVIQKGDPDFDCIVAGGKIVHVIPYVVTRIWKFPDGRVKTESTMTVPPYEKMTETHTEWMIQDWYPAEGDSVQDWINARRRAGGFVKYEYQN